MTNTEAVTSTIPAERVLGSVLGLAYGDAIGDPVEFRKYREIPRAGVSIPESFRITDDTQMSLAVWSALDAWDTPSLGMLRMELAVAFLAWKDDPDNNRAPGATCMSALGRLDRVGLGHWLQATSPGSAGCGSVMRAPWIGLRSDLTDEQVRQVAQMQAALTHAPGENAYCASALASLTRAIARGEVLPGEAVQFLIDEEARLREMGYDNAALSEVWRVAKASDAPAAGHLNPRSYLEEGLTHVRWLRSRAFDLTEALLDDPWGFDPAAITGEGWRAREAVALAVGVFDALGEVYTPVTALQRAAETSGDSDSVAAITGALVGAHVGDEGFPSHWLLRVEPRYQFELMRAGGRV